ncbi:hypothetical protein HXP44_18285 [Streptomyces sioyaensis]|uniref:Lipoprotein n=1 Tax=Streptomyces sioyaensis TaxID=67364 RepID=A0A4V1NNU3_9ACTN|nr:hypothetical protein [Streptomyces sioyaensis]MBM4793966.1 hypothetical protein [Streptomyces sioyaensis]RXS59500.1 hypothetical protein EST54_29835 [Streptomyces sioyaensis]
MAEKARRRLRSSTVILGGMGALAAALTSCGSEPDKRCVDRNSYDTLKGYRIVEAKNCSAGGGSSSTSGTTSGTTTGKYGKSGRGGGTGRQPVDAQWYYDPGNSGGKYADDGTFSRATAVNRGGFGCSGSHGSGGGRHGSFGG